MAFDLGENEIIFLPSYFISSPKIVSVFGKSYLKKSSKNVALRLIIFELV